MRSYLILINAIKRCKNNTRISIDDKDSRYLALVSLMSCSLYLNSTSDISLRHFKRLSSSLISVVLHNYIA